MMGLSKSYGKMEDVKVGRRYLLPDKSQILITLIRLVDGGCLHVTGKDETGKAYSFTGFPATPNFLEPAE